ncbi:hypothetical protein Glove_218g17 [Diversispora epigaea]|uniref:Anaphase-promoting complex subunit 4 WD40 domain-containing protein n=1 Tax=Diversispora epigaea TaxID=1348612 RepID=A0A397IGF9_9GLOM|nr:hypothetical protein Glove_218g17 [Diversispora epigaea]
MNHQIQEISGVHLFNLKIAREFYDNSQPITALDFDGTGEYCVTASADETINLYNCRTGNHGKFSVSKKYGVHLTRFTHSNTEIVYASTKENDTLRYLSLRDNQFIRYFVGHKSRVVALEMSPINDQFLTGSINEGVRLWDLRQPNEIGFIDIQSGRPCVGYDPSGLIFAIALQHSDKTIQLHDVRKFNETPFSTFKIEEENYNMNIDMDTNVNNDNDNNNDNNNNDNNNNNTLNWTGLKFSNDGQKILINTSGDVHYIMDAFDGNLKQRLIGHAGLDNASSFLGGEESCFTPDGRYVISGSKDGKIYFWDISNSNNNNNNESTTITTAESLTTEESMTMKPFHMLNHHTLPTQVIKFNPNKLLLVSACTDLVFWLPSLNTNELGETEMQLN